MLQGHGLSDSFFSWFICMAQAEPFLIPFLLTLILLLLSATPRFLSTPLKLYFCYFLLLAFFIIHISLFIVFNWF